VPDVLLWALVIALATYRSPFLPQDYAPIGPLWVLAIAASLVSLPPSRLIALAVAFVLVQLYTPFASVTLTTLALASLAADVVAAAIFIAAARIRVQF
jgi:hypothetical protein